MTHWMRASEYMFFSRSLQTLSWTFAASTSFPSSHTNHSCIQTSYMFYFIISKTTNECIVLKTYPELSLDDLRKSGVVCLDAGEVRPAPLSPCARPSRDGSSSSSSTWSPSKCSSSGWAIGLEDAVTWPCPRSLLVDDSSRG